LSHFRIGSELRKFVGEEKHGLFGYIESWCSFDGSLHFKFDELQKESKVLQEQLRKLIYEIEENNALLQLAHSEMLARESIVKQRRAVLLSNNL
jgi:hypothetical protein